MLKDHGYSPPAKGGFNMGKQKYRMRISLVVFISLLFLCFPTLSSANKSSVTIDAPAAAEKGSEITILLNVKHSGNNLFHYTDEVKVSVNGKEVEKWEFSSSKRPEDAYFSREIRYKVDGPLEIVAEANCNIHGSDGPAKKTVSVR